MSYRFDRGLAISLCNSLKFALFWSLNKLNNTHCHFTGGTAARANIISSIGALSITHFLTPRAVQGIALVCGHLLLHFRYATEQRVVPHATLPPHSFSFAEAVDEVFFSMKRTPISTPFIQANSQRRNDEPVVERRRKNSLS